MELAAIVDKNLWALYSPLLRSIKIFMEKALGLLQKYVVKKQFEAILNMRWEISFVDDAIEQAQVYNPSTVVHVVES